MENNKTIERKWYLFDAKGKILGRLSTEIADILRGKKKADFALNKDGGDFVVVVNADDIVMTGRKEDQKRYYQHTGYLGNLKTYTVADLKAKKTGQILINSVTGMLPKNRLQKGFLKRLKVYVTTEHPHSDVKFVNVETK